MLRIRAILPGLILAALVFAIRPAGGQSMFWYTMEFDGGYGFVMNPRGELEVISPVTQPNEVAHPMFLRLERGTFVGATGNAPKIKNGKWDMTGFDFYVDSSGDATKLDLPPFTQVNEPANDCFQPNESVVAEVNNSYYLPALKDLAPTHTPSVALTAINSRVIVRKGRFSIRRAGGCWQFLTPFGASVGKPHALARGFASTKHTLNITATNVDLVLTPKGQTTPTARMTFKPAAGTDPAKPQEVLLWVGRFDAMTAPVAVGEDLHDLMLFYRLVGIAEPGRLPRPYKFNNTGAFTSPGDECPPAFVS